MNKWIQKLWHESLRLHHATCEGLTNAEDVPVSAIRTMPENRSLGSGILALTSEDTVADNCQEEKKSSLPPTSKTSLLEHHANVSVSMKRKPAGEKKARHAANSRGNLSMCLIAWLNYETQTQFFPSGTHIALRAHYSALRCPSMSNEYTYTHEHWVSASMMRRLGRPRPTITGISRLDGRCTRHCSRRRNRRPPEATESDLLHPKQTINSNPSSAAGTCTRSRMPHPSVTS